MDEPVAQGSTPAQKPQFRTYASDVAALTGSHTPLPRELKNAPPVAAHPITMPTKPAVKPWAPASVQPPPAPAVAMPAPTPAPLPEPVAPPAPPAKPYEPPPAKIIPKAPSTDESREAVLARLRAKANVPPAPQPEPAKIYPKAPSTDEARDEVLARLRKNAPGALATPAPAAMPARAPEPPPGLPPINRFEEVPTPEPIHTYKSDFSDQVKETGASKISILAAEQNALGSAKPVPQLTTRAKKGRALYIAGALLLILAGGASIYFAVAFVTGRPVVLVAPSVPSLIFADDRIELKGTSGELRAGLAELSGHALPAGGVAVAYITYASTTPKGGTVMLPAAGGALISAMGLPAPQLLLRNIDPASTVGVVRAGEETRPFFIFRVASFERTFAGMLSWEQTMARDLAVFYPTYPVVSVEAVGTSTASTTAARPVAVQPFTVSFVDEVVDNHDVRVLRDASGKSLFLYGYRDKQTLIIARNEVAFSELLKRLASTRAQ